MARLAFSAAAEDSIRELPRDAVLLGRLWREFEAIADDLEGRTLFPPPYPYRQDRRLASFDVEAGDGTRWAFAATVSVGPAGEVIVHSLRGTDATAYPDQG